MRIEDYCLIFRFGVKSLFAGYRKESSLSKENFVFLPDLSLPPTTIRFEKLNLAGDYWSE
jgi:hypothetical protein